MPKILILFDFLLSDLFTVGSFLSLSQADMDTGKPLFLLVNAFWLSIDWAIDCIKIFTDLLTLAPFLCSLFNHLLCNEMKFGNRLFIRQTTEIFQ